MDETIECCNSECGWRGDPTELVTAEPLDAPVASLKFDRCPYCGGTEFDDLDDDEPEE